MKDFCLAGGYVLNDDITTALVDRILPEADMDIHYKLHAQDFIKFDNKDHTFYSKMAIEPKSSLGIRLYNNNNLVDLSSKEQSFDDEFRFLLGLYNFNIRADGLFDKISDLENFKNKDVLSNKFLIEKTISNLPNKSATHVLLSKPTVLYKELPLEENISIYEKPADNYTGYLLWSGVLLEK